MPVTKKRGRPPKKPVEEDWMEEVPTAEVPTAEEPVTETSADKELPEVEEEMGEPADVARSPFPPGHPLYQVPDRSVPRATVENSISRSDRAEQVKPQWSFETNESRAYRRAHMGEGHVPSWANAYPSGPPAPPVEQTPVRTPEELQAEIIQLKKKLSELSDMVGRGVEPT